MKLEEKGLPSVLYIERKKGRLWNHIDNIEVLTERLRCRKSKYRCLLFLLGSWRLWRRSTHLRLFSVLRSSRCIKWHNRTLPKNKSFMKKPVMNGNVDCKVPWGLGRFHSLEMNKDRRNAVVYRLKAPWQFLTCVCLTILSLSPPPSSLCIGLHGTFKIRTFFKIRLHTGTSSSGVSLNYLLAVLMIKNKQRWIEKRSSYPVVTPAAIRTRSAWNSSGCIEEN